MRRPATRRGVAALITERVLEYEDDIVFDIPEGASCSAPRTGCTASALSRRPGAVCGAAEWHQQ